MQRVPISRGKVLGGTSAIDDMTYMRGSPHVFDLWEEMGSEGWNRTDVLPYFIKAEDYIASAKTNNSNPGMEDNIWSFWAALNYVLFYI